MAALLLPGHAAKRYPSLLSQHYKTELALNHHHPTATQLPFGLDLQRDGCCCFSARAKVAEPPEAHQRELDQSDRDSTHDSLRYRRHYFSDLPLGYYPERLLLGDVRLARSIPVALLLITVPTWQLGSAATLAAFDTCLGASQIEWQASPRI